MTTTFIDLFAGIGGFRLGIENAAKKLNIPVKCVFSSEIDEHARRIYEQNFDTTPSGDITTIDTIDIPDMDILCGGFPCPSFSIAGKQEGFCDPRGKLFFEIARIAKEKQPKILFLENVKNLLSHDGGRTFATILCTLDECGYDVEWQCLNSQCFGIPHHRERVFIIGHLRGGSTRQIFPIDQSERVHFKTTECSEIEGEWFWGSDCASALTRNYSKGVHCGGETYILTNHVVLPHEYIVTYVDSDTGELYEGEMRNEYDDEMVMCPHCGVDFGECDCLGISSVFEPGETEHVYLRRLTPIECERLQGFPDNWTEGISDNNRYKCLGNAVTVNVIEAIAERFLKELA